MREQLFYHAPGARTGDVIPKYIDGTYQLFYLKNWKDPHTPDAVHGWHRLESEDLVHMSAETPIYVQGGTGDLIYRNGWHLFACIFPEGRQYVTHYISADGSLDHWEQIEEDTFGPDGVIYDYRDWRDPRIVYRKELDEYWMFLAARKADVHSQTGCVGLCVSKDLRRWEYRPPIYYPQRFAGACECPDVFRMGDWYYLIFSSYTNLFGNYYVKCRAGESEWRIPDNHRLDGRAFYAAKSAGHGMERYLFGWNPTKEENTYGFWPDGLKAKDYRTWDWGGCMVVHRLVQKENGDLGLALPDARRALFDRAVRNSVCVRTEGWELSENRFEAKHSAAQQMLLLGKLPESFYLSLDIAGDAGQMGVILQADESLQEGYYLYIEPRRGRLAYRSWLRMSEDGGKTFPYDVELEAPAEKSADGRYHMEIAAEGSAATAYVSGGAALSFRMYDYSGRRLGLFAFGRAVFENLMLKERSDTIV